MANPKHYPNGPGPIGLSARSSNCMINNGFDWRDKSQDDQLRLVKEFCAFIFERTSASSTMPRWKSLQNFGKVCAEEFNQLACIYEPRLVEEKPAQDQYFSAKDIHAKVVIEIDRVVAQQVKKITPKEYNLERMIDTNIAEMVRSHACRVTQRYREDVLEKKMNDLVDAEISRRLNEKNVSEYIDQAIHTKVTEAIGALEKSIFERVMRAKFMQPKTRYLKEFHELLADAITEAYRKD